jgi:hypothetical protein
MVAAPQLGGHLREVNGQLVGTIENRSTTTFNDAVVIAGDGFQKLGRLVPGATASVAFTPRAWTFNGPPAIQSIYPNYSFGPSLGQASDAQREGEMRTRMLFLLQSSGSFKGIPTTVYVPMVVGWTGQSLQDITVNGAHPRPHGETAVAVTLPVEQVGAGPLPGGIVNGRLVDFEGDRAGQGPPGAVIIQSGTVTYRFDAPLAPGLRLTAASISASNPYFGKSPPGVAGTTTTIRGEGWDWSRSAWVDIKYQDNATTVLPEEVVNPASGEIRVRVVVSNGSFLTTGITLTGTVQ